MTAASGDITARYHVQYRINTRAGTAAQAMNVALTSGYTTFESIPAIVATRVGVKPDEVDILSAVRIQEGPRTPWGALIAARAAYIREARLHGWTDYAELLENLNPRVWPLSDGRDGDTSPRHVVDLFGVTVDVRRTVNGLVVDLNAEEVAEGDKPVEVNLGSTTLT